MLPFRLPLSELASLLVVLVLGLGLRPGVLRRLPPPPPPLPPASSPRLDGPLPMLMLLALLLLLRRRVAMAFGSSFPSPLLDDGLSICAVRPRLFPAPAPGPSFCKAMRRDAMLRSAPGARDKLCHGHAAKTGACQE